MDYYIPGQDSYFSRVVDGLVLIMIGVAIGVVISQVALTQEVSTITTKAEIINQGGGTVSPNAQETYNTSLYDIPEGVELEEN